MWDYKTLTVLLHIIWPLPHSIDHLLHSVETMLPNINFTTNTGWLSRWTLIKCPLADTMSILCACLSLWEKVRGLWLRSEPGRHTARQTMQTYREIFQNGQTYTALPHIFSQMADKFRHFNLILIHLVNQKCTQPNDMKWNWSRNDTT